jgi:hypothetical protein
MMTLRLTAKSLKKFRVKPRLVTEQTAEGGLGEWYVTTVDSINRGNLFMVVMHAPSLYSMLVTIEKSMDPGVFTKAVFSSLLQRLLRIEIPADKIAEIMNSHEGRAVYAKTESRSLVAHISTIVKDIDAAVFHTDIYLIDDAIDLTALENRINETPRSVKGSYIWPARTFYESIRSIYPELPKRAPLNLDRIVYNYPIETMMNVFAGKIPEKLAAKVHTSSYDSLVFFDTDEINALLQAVRRPFPRPAGIPENLYTDLEWMLSRQLEKRENRQ